MPFCFSLYNCSFFASGTFSPVPTISQCLCPFLPETNLSVLTGSGSFRRQCLDRSTDRGHQLCSQLSFNATKTTQKCSFTSANLSLLTTSLLLCRLGAPLLPLLFIYIFCLFCPVFGCISLFRRVFAYSYLVLTCVYTRTDVGNGVGRHSSPSLYH